MEGSNFELLDRLLDNEPENISEETDGEKTEEQLTEEKTEDKSDQETQIESEDLSDIYESLDEMIEESMRETLMDIVILNSGDGVEELVEQIETLRSAEFTEDQMLRYLDEMMTPALKLSGVFIEGSVAVNVPVLEIARGINSYNNEKLEELNEFVVEGKEFSNSLPQELNCYMDTVFADWGITEVDEQTKIIDEAEKVAPDYDKLCLELSDAIALTYLYSIVPHEKDDINALVENCGISGTIREIANLFNARKGSQSISEMWKTIEEVETPGKEVAKGAAGAAAVVGGTAAAALAVLSKARSKGGFVAGIALATAASVIASLAYAKYIQGKCGKKDVGHGRWACYEAAAKKAAADMKSKRSRCKKTKNPAKCEAKIDAGIAKWDDRAEKYAEKEKSAKKAA